MSDQCTSSTTMRRPRIVNANQTVEVSGLATQGISFSSSTGTLIIDHSRFYTGTVSGLSGSDALDLRDIQFDSHTTVTFLGTANGGSLTVSDGTHGGNLAVLSSLLA